MSFLLHVSGPLGCFARPEFERDRISYDVMTPLAARGIFESIHWTPSIRWSIASITVLNPIRIEPVFQETGADNGKFASPQTTLGLVDLAYVVHGRLTLTERAKAGESTGQHLAMFGRRARQGRFFRDPYLGFRHLAADMALLDEADVPAPSEALLGDRDLGWMLHDRHPDDGRFHYFRARMIDGFIDTTGPWEYPLAS